MDKLCKKWKAVATNGSVAMVWVDEMACGHFWRWAAWYADGSGYRTDICSSRRLAVEEAKIVLGRMTKQRPLPRFKKEL